jgi:hypothetical protein
MTNPRRLPLLTLIAVSMLVCLGSLIVVFFLSVDAKTFGEKAQSALTLGLPSAIVLIFLLWLGAGIDHLLARIAGKSARLWVSLGTYLFAPGLLCIGLPALIIVLFSASLFPQQGWQELPAPPSPAVEVSAAGESSAIIRTDSGEYLYCWVITPEDCWQSADAPQERTIQNSMGDLKETANPPASDPPGEIASRISVTYYDMGVEVFVHYAALRDGSIWYLEENADDYETGFATGLFLSLALIPAISGLLVIYLGAGVSALSRRIASRSQ